MHHHELHQDRRRRLYDALAACDEALKFRRPDTAPLAYATTQNNRGLVLRDLATLPGEDRRRRLYDALAAYDAALEFYRPDTAPLDYAMTQGNLANLFQEFAETEGEARHERMLQSLRAAWEALLGFERAQHQQFMERAARKLKQLKETWGTEFDRLWNELGVGEPPAWLMQDESPAQQINLAPLYAFLNSRDAREMRRLVEENAWLTAPEIESLLDQIQAQVKADEQAAQMLAFKRALLQEIRNKGIEQAFVDLERAAQLSETIARLNAQLKTYLEKQQAAAQSENDVTLWQETVNAGEALLFAEEFQALDGVNWDALKADLAGVYNSLGVALDKQPDKTAALAAFERAIALDPKQAMWRRNRAGTLIELGRLDEAEQEIARARELEPQAPRLAQLEAELHAARGRAVNG